MIDRAKVFSALELAYKALESVSKTCTTAQAVRMKAYKDFKAEKGHDITTIEWADEAYTQAWDAVQDAWAVINALELALDSRIPSLNK